MTEKLVIGDATLFKGNALDIMRELIQQGVRADMVCCDPPYLLTSGGGNPKGGRRMSGKFNNKNYDNGGHLVACDLDWNDFMPLFFQIMERGHAYVMSNNRHLQNMLCAAETSGFGFHNMLVWDKGNATPNRWYMKNCEFTGLFYKGKAKFINECGSKALIKYQWSDESKHPTEKPVPLMEHYILNSTQPGDLVIDPFMGSGSTGVAAIKNGRRFIGIEIEQQWFDVSAMRIEKTLKHLQNSLF